MKRALCGLLVLTLAVAPGCGKGSGGGAASPQASFDAFKGAMSSKDYKKGFEQTTPETQEGMLGVMAMMGAFMSAFDPNKGTEFQAILTKHGLKMDEKPDPAANPATAMKSMMASVKDKPAALHEILVWFEKNSQDKDGPAKGMQEMASAELVDLKTSGDTATANVKTKKDGQDKTDPIKFKKIGGGWFIDMSDMMKEGPGPSGGPGPGGAGIGGPADVTPPGGGLPLDAPLPIEPGAGGDK